MDIIEKLIADHREVKEHEDIARKLLGLIDKDAFFWDNAVKVSRFFKKEVREHFKIEEDVLFPVAEKILSGAEAGVLKDIRSEHGPIINKVDELDAISEQHLRYPSKSTRELFIKTCSEILELLVPHAQKEDAELFPLIKSRFAGPQFKELEEKYFSFLKF